MERQTELLQSFLEEWHKGQGVTVHTSGSTGEPKEIVLSPSHICRSGRRSNQFFGITKKSRLHSAVSFKYIGGKMMIARSLLSGAQLSFSEPSLHIENISENDNIALMSVVPAQIPYILDNLSCFKNVDQFLIGGSAIHDKLWNRIVESGINAWESYGMTETASHIALRRVVGPCGRRPRFVAFPGIKVSLDPDDCLHIVDDEVVVTTNDIANLYPDRSFEILGRRDDVIISGGIKVLPQHIEKIIKPYIEPICQDFFITSVSDEIWTSKIVLAVVSASCDMSLSASLRHAIDRIPLDILSKKLRPKDIRIFAEAPLAQSGKLLRRLE